MCGATIACGVPVRVAMLAYRQRIHDAVDAHARG